VNSQQLQRLLLLPRINVSHFALHTITTYTPTRKLHPLDLTYFDCPKIFELLKQANESDAKNIFGQYTSKRMKDWSDIMKQYEKDNIFLAEAVTLLSSYVNYDL
jgi:hypothetical protein